MTAIPTPPELVMLQDDELEALAVRWRADARRGARQAFGIAHALEVECRRRLRARATQEAPPVMESSRPWWKMWRSNTHMGASAIAR